MIKYLHEHTLGEIKALIESGIKEGITWAEFAERYPQPDWCLYPDATSGQMGCQSLIWGMVTGKEYCKSCECCKSVPAEEEAK